ncbi:hypothetical protein B0T10DRAFT_495063 [Thelonectria olida]|uniref:N-acetyltransferase domain-containing protein n=1 Tax=Thelonectria olida TaxID=1576542 RepID=A0A9P8VW78_9HYPO|nr:hypothetical protein B0T10DRAFT_495063 [Thelonectria olida]
MGGKFAIATGDIQYPLALITSNLILVPTPLSVSSSSYRALYAALHKDASFCEMGFGDHFPARAWTDQETYQTITGRDINVAWRNRGLGDFAVGLWSEDVEKELVGKIGTGKEISAPNFTEKLRRLDMSETSPSQLEAALNNIEWVGYAGIREGPEPDTASLESPVPWEERVELRYGVSPDHWGKAIAFASAAAVMNWGAAERGVTKFIAETERANTRSGRVLERLGFVRLEEVKYWKEESQVEWEMSTRVQ